MALTLITGRANTGKTGLLYEGLDDVRSATVLVPTHPDSVRARDEFSTRRVMGVRVDTLDSWTEDMWSLWGDGRRLVTRETRRAIAEQAVGETSLSRADDGRGVARLVAELASRRVGELDLAEASSSEREIARALDAYGAMLRDAGMIEPAAAASLLAAASPRVVGPVVVNRFTDLPPWQERLLVAVSRECDVRIALPWERGFAPTEALTPLVERLASLGVHEHLGTPPPEGELRHVEASLYDPREPVQPAGEVRFCLASGREAEVETVVEQVKEYLEAGVRADRIAIVFPRLDERSRRLRNALAVEGVPADVDVSVPLRRTAFGRALNSLLRVALGDEGREALMAFLATHYNDAQSAEIAAADARWRRERLQEPPALLSSASRLGRRAREEIRAARRAVRGRLPESLDAWTALLDGMMACAVSTPTLDEDVRAWDVAAHGEAARVVSGLAGLPYGAGAREVLAALDEAHVTPRTGSTGGVQVTEARRVRSRRFDVLVVGGLTAGEFTSEVREPLADDIGRRLGLPHGRDEREAARLLFYSLATRPRRALVLLREAVDESGEPVRPSVFWDEMLDLYREPDEEDSEFPRAVHPVRTDGSDVIGVAPAYTRGRKEDRRRVAPRRRKRTHELDDDVLAHLEATDEFSVTELEKYLVCPYRWFHERQLRPRQLDRELDPGERGALVHDVLARFYRGLRDELGIGRVVPAELDRALDLLRRVSEQALGERDLRARGVAEQLGVERALEQAREVVVRDATMLSGFEPKHTELRFGRETGTPAAFAGVALRGSIDRVDEGNQGIVVTDYKTKPNVIGRRSFEGHVLLQAPVYGAIASQVLGRPLVGSVYRSTVSHVSRGFWRTDMADPPPGCIANDHVDEAGVAEVMERAAEMLSSAVEGIRSGRIAPDPRKDVCRYCGAALFCEGGG